MSKFDKLIFIIIYRFYRIESFTHVMQHRLLCVFMFDWQLIIMSYQSCRNVTLIRSSYWSDNSQWKISKTFAFDFVNNFDQIRFNFDFEFRTNIYTVVHSVFLSLSDIACCWDSSISRELKLSYYDNDRKYICTFVFVFIFFLSVCYSFDSIRVILSFKQCFKLKLHAIFML